MTYVHIDQFDHNNLEPFKIIDVDNDINNQIQLASAEDSGTREDTVNGFESGATEIRWDGIDPTLFGLKGYNSIKLSCFDNGKGMTKETLLDVTNFSSSKGKRKGLKGHKGKGAKLSWMKSNQAGLVWISSAFDKNLKKYKVYRVVMVGDIKQEKWGKKSFWIENDQTGVDSWQTAVDITDMIDWKELPEHFKKESTWTLKIFCGNDMKQNTVKQPYHFGKDIAGGWLMRELARRFLSTPKSVTIMVGETQKHLTNDNIKKFESFYEVLTKNAGNVNDKTQKLRFETVLVNKDGSGIPENIGQDFPFYVESNQCAVTYVIDDFCGAKGNEEKSYSWYKSRMGITSVWSGIGWQPHNEGQEWSELYDYKGPLWKVGGNTWRQCAAELGIMNAWRKCRVICHEGDSDEIINNEDRTKIVNPKDSKTAEYLLKNRKDLVWKAMPDFFKEFLDDNKVVESMEDIRAQLDERLKQMKSILKGTPLEGGPEEKFVPQGGPGKTKCPKCGVDFPRGQKKCGNCGYVRPKSKFSPNPNTIDGYVQDPNGKVRIVRKFPDIVEVAKGEAKDRSLDDKFEIMAGQYMSDDNKLFVNINYSAFKNLARALVKSKDIDRDDPSYKDAFDQGMADAKSIIIKECIGEKFCVALAKSSVSGFRDEDTFKMMTDPRMISVYADTYCDPNVISRALNSWKNKVIDSSTSNNEEDTKDNNISETVAKANAIDPNLLKIPTA